MIPKFYILSYLKIRCINHVFASAKGSISVSTACLRFAFAFYLFFLKLPTGQKYVNANQTTSKV